MKSERIGIKLITRYSLLVTVFILFTVYCSLFTDVYALDVKKSVLENGLTLLIVEKHNLPVVRVTVGIKAGSIVESEEKAGIANLTAELLTAGTKKRTASQISEETEFAGASLSASGGSDYATVALSVLKKDLDLGIDLLSDTILNPSFPDDELNKKRERIKGGLRAQEENP